MPFYLAWVYGKGQTFLENLHPNSLPLHMVVLENTTLFFGQFRKGNVSPWDRCELNTKVAKNPSILLIGAYPDENG